MSKTITFRGLLGDGTQEKIHLGTLTGTTGYRIKKFQLMPYDVSDEDYEAVVKIYKVVQTAVDHNVSFSDNTLLAAGIWTSSSSANVYPDDLNIIFEIELFNQNIFVTYKDTKTNTGMNYYLELEQVKLDSNETAVATLKNIKNR